MATKSRSPDLPVIPRGIQRVCWSRLQTFAAVWYEMFTVRYCKHSVVQHGLSCQSIQSIYAYIHVHARTKR